MKKHYSVEVAGKYGRSSSTIMDKITKRYSAIGSRLMRKSPGRKSGVADPITGSYDMTGGRFDDFRPEIGIPVLISKTTKFDFDSDVPIDEHQQQQEEEQQQEQSTPRPSRSPAPVSIVTRSTSDDSENDIFVDANSSLPNFSDIKFTFLPESNNNYSTYLDENDKENQVHLQRIRSKSAHNLHQPELRHCIEKTTSLNLSGLSNGELTAATSITVPNSPAVDSIYDFPRSTKVGDSTYDLAHANLILNEINLSLVTDGDTTHLYHNVPNGSHVTTSNGVLHNAAFDYSGSNQSFQSNSTQEEEFDLKSASFQSLDARHLFLSIEELDEITRQINESDMFKETNNEYCEHRNRLHPTERRLTLLKNKTAPKHFIDFDRKKAKLTKKWSGFKHWIGEEQDKIKDVVHKHAAMQRVGGEVTKQTGATGKRNSSSEVGSEADAGACVGDSELNLSMSVVNGGEAASETAEHENGHRKKQHSAEILEVSDYCLIDNVTGMILN